MSAPIRKVTTLSFDLNKIKDDKNLDSHQIEAKNTLLLAL